MAVGKEAILASVLPSRLQFLRLNLKRSRLSVPEPLALLEK